MPIEVMLHNRPSGDYTVDPEPLEQIPFALLAGPPFPTPIVLAPPSVACTIAPPQLSYRVLPPLLRPWFG